MTLSEVKISVVTAVLNRERTIGECLDSALSQRNVDFEILVQDGGSVDGTLEKISARRDPRIYLKQEADSGIYDGLNRGISRASGNIIGFLHSDDVFSGPYVLEAVSRVLAEKDFDGVYGDLEYVAADDMSRVIRRWRSGKYSSAKLKRGWMPPHPTLFLRREVYERHGLYDTSFGVSADYEAILRYLVKGNIRLAYLPETLVRMRVGGASNRSISQLIRKSLEDYIAIRRYRIGGLRTVALKIFSKIGQFF